MVYVDEIRVYPHGPRGYTHWCHMWADSLDELHAMADAIGLRRAWFQNHRHLPHYDLTPSRRALALRHGAHTRTWRELGEVVWARVQAGKEAD